MYKSFDIYQDEPLNDDICYFPSFESFGGFTKITWKILRCINYPQFPIFKNWESAKNGSDFILDLLKTNHDQFSYLTSVDGDDYVYFVSLGYLLEHTIQVVPFNKLANGEYLLKCGLLYSSYKYAKNAQKLMFQALDNKMKDISKIEII